MRRTAPHGATVRNMAQNGATMRHSAPHCAAQFKTDPPASERPRPARVANPRRRPYLLPSIMLYRTLGKTGWQVSVIGLGAWGIGGQWGPVERETALSTVKAAHDAGVTFFDTADIYGEPRQGQSEELVGEEIGRAH